MNEVEKARIASFYDEIITEKNKIIIRLQKRINKLEATSTEKTIEELRSKFEETETFKLYYSWQMDFDDVVKTGGKTVYCCDGYGFTADEIKPIIRSN